MKRFVFFLVILAFAAQFLAGTTYYIDATYGNDSNSGTSTSSPWKTLAKIRGRTFSPGDSILLKRGQVWREYLLIENYSGTSSNPITFGAYGSGNKPQINGSATASGWTQISNSVYEKAFAYPPTVIVQNGMRLGRIPWKANLTDTLAGASPGCWSYDPSRNLTFIWTENNTDPDASTTEVAIATGVEDYGIFIRNANHIIVQDIEVKNTPLTGVYMRPSEGSDTNNITLRRLTISNTGKCGITASNSANAPSANHEIYGLVIDGCTVHHTEYHGIGLSHEVVGAVIKNNTVYTIGLGREGCHGITSWSDKSNAYVRSCIIEKNNVSGVLTSSSGVEGTGIHSDDLTRDCTYRYNIAHNNEGSGFYDRGVSGNKWYYNIAYNNGSVNYGKYRGGISIGETANCKVYNNVCYNNSPVGIGLYGDGTNGVSIRNNICYENASYEIRVATYATTGVSSDYNCVYHSAGGNFMQWNGSTYNWAGWQSSANQGAHSINANPRFISAGNKNFDLQSSSPCIDAGTNVGLTKDITGTTVPQSGKVDIGAYETSYSSSDPDPLEISISASPTSGTAPLTVNFTRNVSGGTDPYDYYWQFDDGSTSTTNNPTHTFDTAGTYTVRLTVTDSTGEQDTDTQSITVNSPASDLSIYISASPTSGPAPLTVSFERNVSGGTGPFSYNWNFGDGSTSTTNNPTHTFDTAGTYTVRLTVTDSTSQQDSDTQTITVNNPAPPLDISFTANPTSGTAPLTVNFTRSVSGGTSPYTNNWNFGDGSTSTTNNPTHTFDTAGTYTVSLTVTDSAGQQDSAQKTITVNGSSSFTIWITADKTSGTSPLTVNFQRNVSGGTSPFSYNWNFGDGSTSTTNNPSHTFNSPGDYTVTLTVTDSTNAKRSDTESISVYSQTSSQYSLSIASSTGSPAPGSGGTVSPSPGNHSYSSGRNVQVTATANAKYRFAIWEGDVSSSIAGNRQITVTMNRDKSITAKFCTRCGDVNGDATITPTDAQMIFEIFLGRLNNPTFCQMENADVNCDGTKDNPSVTPSDAQIIFDNYLGKGSIPSDCSCNSRSASAGSFTSTTQAIPFEFSLFIPDQQFIPGEMVYIPISIDRSITLNSFGIDLLYDHGLLEFIGVARTDMTKDFIGVDGNVIEDGLLRVGGYRENSLDQVLPGDVIILIFRVASDVLDQKPVSILKTYDDLKQAVFNE